MSIWHLARHGEAREHFRYDLLDFVVLLAIARWGQAASQARFTYSGKEENTIILNGLLVLIAADLKRSGYALDLSLQFKDPDTMDAEIIESHSIAQAVRMLEARDLMVPQGNGAPYPRVSALGIRTLEGMWTHFADRRVVSENASASVKWSDDRQWLLGISETVDRFAGSYSRWSPQEVRSACVSLAFALLDVGSFPRTYSFHERYVPMLVSFSNRSGRRYPEAWGR